MAQIAYRVAQFQAALHAVISPAEEALAQQTLTSGEYTLFRRMPIYDQRHCLDVYATLVATGTRDDLLLRAALIHDCGKVGDDGSPMPLHWYVAITILKQLPILYIALARPGTPLPLVQRYAEHAWRGAHLAAQAGCPPEMVTTLRHYHDPHPTGRAARLQWADQQH
jgi:predicted HD phosphohydrolase